LDPMIDLLKISAGAFMEAGLRKRHTAQPDKRGRQCDERCPHQQDNQQGGYWRIWQDALGRRVGFRNIHACLARDDRQQGAISSVIGRRLSTLASKIRPHEMEKMLRYYPVEMTPAIIA
jgi:hypothetical protein